VKYRIWRTLFAGAAVLAGAVYLWGGGGALSFVLPFMAACFCGMCIVAFCGARSVERGSGFVRWLPAVGAAIVAGFATLGAALWFAG